MVLRWRWGEINDKVVFFFRTKNILIASENYGWTPDVTWIIWTVSLLRFLLRKTLGWVINDRILIFGWTIPLKHIPTPNIWMAVCVCVYMKSSFPKRDKRQIKKKMSLSCHFAVYWTYSLLHQCFMPNRYISLFKMYCKMQFFSKPL